MPLEHFLLTRFNVRIGPGLGWDSREAAAARWLDERFELFETFCLPSILGQTRQDFAWLMFCDRDTSEQHLDRLRQASPRIQIVLCEPGGRISGEVASLDPFLESEPDRVVSTRVDNDDALNVRAVARIQRYARSFEPRDGRPAVFSFARGYQYDAETRTLFKMHKRRNAFITVIERYSGPGSARGALGGHHGELYDRFLSHEDTSLRAWLQVVHGGNVTNRISRRDRPTANISELSEKFGIQVPPH